MAASSSQSTKWQWKAPAGVQSELKIHNSFTRTKVPFATQSSSNQVTSYSCGPTVYDASHMGHARSYITFDIVRRVLRDYFGYNVLWVMNITDVDDKIILKARRSHLFEQYVASQQDREKAAEDIKKALSEYEAKIAKKAADQNLSDDDKFKLKNQQATALAVHKALGDTTVPLADLLQTSQEVLAQYFDVLHGSEISDPAVFLKIAKFYEEQFHEDMAALNVLPADVLTRVSDYIPEIVKYVEKIIANGYAYEANGSVYFHTQDFHGKNGHHYCKLMPEANNNTALLAEGEGELSNAATDSGKQSPRDFALWKKSKAGEPAWDSPWGKGRPGWHIECSAMASEILGQRMDMHCGGIDLRFPHHDNEIAQAEAFYDHDEWIGYFLHAGHLEIEGLKMSKSLKNFVTIRDALKQYSSRQLRLLFLMHGWHDTLNYSKNALDAAIGIERTFNEFFLNVKARLREHGTLTAASAQKYTDAEKNLLNALTEKSRRVHEAISDDLDTRSALEILSTLVTDVNNYMKNVKVIEGHLVVKIASYITHIFYVFGLCEGKPDMGFGSSSGSANTEDAVFPVAKAFADFRDEVRKVAMASKETTLLTACDNVRDNVLPELGIRLEDRDSGEAVVKLDDPATLMRERERKLAEQEAIRLKKEENKRKLAEAAAAKEAQRRIDPRTMFLNDSKYSAFDEQGIPTTNADGTEVTKSARKTLQKLWDKQEELFNPKEKKPKEQKE